MAVAEEKNVLFVYRTKTPQKTTADKVFQVSFDSTSSIKIEGHKLSGNWAITDTEWVYGAVTGVTTQMNTSLTGAFTVEFYVKLKSLPIASVNSSFASIGVFDTGLMINNHSNQSSVTGEQLSVLQLGAKVVAFRHIAMTRDNDGFVRIFVDGVMVYKSNNAMLGSLTTKDQLANGNGSMSGVVVEMRLTKGRALYTESFTPPDRPL